MTEPQIYIVDDDDAVRDSLALLLTFRGWRSHTYASAEAFLADWRADWRGCLLLDLRLGGMDGLALQETLTQRGNRLPIVFLTGHGDVAQARLALKAGAIDFLEKPYTEEALLAAVQEALARDARQHIHQTRSAEIDARMARLTERERQVMDLVVEGKPNRDIAVLLDISPRTVEVFKARMMEKMQARSLPELVRLVIEGNVQGDAT